MTSWSNLTELQLRTLLRSHGQPTSGSKTLLVQRFAAFMSTAAGCDEGPGTATDDGCSISADRWQTPMQLVSAVSRASAAALSKFTASSPAAATAAALAAAATARLGLVTEATVATAFATLQAHRVLHNEQTCALLQLVGQEDLRPTFMRAEVWGVVGLWRLRGVCRAFRRWARAELSSLPRVVAVGGVVKDRSVVLLKEDDEDDDDYEIATWAATASVESLDLSTMRWSVADCMSLPDPRAMHSVSSCCADGRVVVCSGYNFGGADPMHHLGRTALQWLPATGAWSALPDQPGDCGAASVLLPDGRTMLIGGYRSSEGQVLASVLVLVADGSGWSDLAPLMGARAVAVAALLPDGKVLVAGGQSGDGFDSALNTAELWDPATQKWTALPPMACKRSCAAACVLSGRVAVVGGFDPDGMICHDGEVFDPVKCEWAPLGAEMASIPDISAVTVCGGLVVVGATEDDEPNELYDEQSGRWFELPHAMVEPRFGTGLVLLPAAALVATAAVPN